MPADVSVVTAAVEAPVVAAGPPVDFSFSAAFLRCRSAAFAVVDNTAVGTFDFCEGPDHHANLTTK